MDDYRIRVAKALEMARAESGLSQQKLADKMGIGRTSIFRYEQGTMTPDAPTIIKWFVCCGVAAKPYIDTCLHPGLLESLAGDASTERKRDTLIEHIKEAHPQEIDLLCYMIYGNHGSDYLAVLCEMVANLHTTLRDRVSVCRTVTGHYEMAQATKTDQLQKILIHSDYLNNEIAIRINRFNFLAPFSPYTKEIIISK